MTPLAKLHQHILRSITMDVDDDGLVHTLQNGEPEPVNINGAKLRLSSASGVPEPNVHLLHLFFEPISGAELPSMEKIRKMAISTIMHRVSLLISEVIKFALDKDQRAGAPETLSELLVAASGVKPTTLRAWEKIMLAMKNNASLRLVHLSSRGRMKMGEREYSRGCVVNWPLFEELTKPNATTYGGITLTRADHAALVSILKFVIPNIEVKGAYNSVGVLEHGPANNAVLRAFAAIMTPVNVICANLSEISLTAAGLAVDLGWQQALEDLTPYLAEIKSWRVPTVPSSLKTAAAAATPPQAAQIALPVERPTPVAAPTPAAPAVSVARPLPPAATPPNYGAPAVTQVANNAPGQFAPAGRTLSEAMRITQQQPQAMQHPQQTTVINGILHVNQNGMWMPVQQQQQPPQTTIINGIMHVNQNGTWMPVQQPQQPMHMQQTQQPMHMQQTQQPWQDAQGRWWMTDAYGRMVPYQPAAQMPMAYGQAYYPAAAPMAQAAGVNLGSVGLGSPATAPHSGVGFAF